MIEGIEKYVKKEVTLADDSGIKKIEVKETREEREERLKSEKKLEAMGVESLEELKGYADSIDMPEIEFVANAKALEMTAEEFANKIKKEEAEKVELEADLKEIDEANANTDADVNANGIRKLQL